MFIYTKRVRVMSVQYSESFDQHKLNYIIKNSRKFDFRIHDAKYDPVNTSAKYLSKSHGGKINVSYDFAKGTNSGRLFANDGVSLQNLCREVRHAIAKDYYDDLDIVNAHPVILKFVCETHNIPVSYTHLTLPTNREV